jgi:alkylresorcinol/alkylpyrone synthase
VSRLYVEAPYARVLSLGMALPPHRVTQEEAKDLARRVFGDDPRTRSLRRFLRNSGVETRYLALPPEELAARRKAGERADLYVRLALDLAEGAARIALEGAGLDPRDVDRLVVTSTTGEPTPSLDTRLVFTLGCDPRTTRPRSARGHGCAGGAEELGEAAAWARANPGGVALVVTVELCSLTIQPDDLSRANLAGAALFGDGAAAAVLSTEGEGPEVLGAGTTMWADTDHMMGWRHEDRGLFLVLDPEVPELVGREFMPSLRRAAGGVGLRVEDLRHHLLHPGGAKVLDAMEDALGLRRGGLVHPRAVLREVGNLSSATALCVLHRCLKLGACEPGDLGVVSAMGPGFRVEHVFVRF